MEQIVYKGVRINLIDCFDRGKYWMIPRRIVNKFNNNGHDLILKSECLTLDDYIKKLEHHKTTTVGLYATDRPDLIEDPKNIMFRINH